MKCARGMVLLPLEIPAATCVGHEAGSEAVMTGALIPRAMSKGRDGRPRGVGPWLIFGLAAVLSTSAAAGVPASGATKTKKVTGTTKVTRSRSKATTKAPNAALPATTTGAPQTTVPPPPSTATTPGVNYVKILSAAGSTESDFGPGYRFLGDPTEAVFASQYRKVTESIAACNGFPDEMPFPTAKAKDIKGWIYSNSSTGKGVPHSVVIMADEQTARTVMESIRNFPATPACLAGFNDGMSQVNGARDNPSLVGKDFKFSSTARFGPELPALGVDQIAVQFDQTLVVDGVSQGTIKFVRYQVRVGPAIMLIADEVSAADRVAPILVAKLQAALKQ